MKRFTNPANMRGFTLLEVMVALAIIALALVAMAEAMGQALNEATAMRERTYASWIAQNKIVELRINNELPEPGISGGEEEYAGSVWEWEAEIAAIEGFDNLMRVDVMVSRPGAEAPIRQVTGFIGEPVVPGQSNQVWAQLSFRDSKDDDDDDGVDVGGATE